jgi:hypothetical protein
MNVVVDDVHHSISNSVGPDRNIRRRATRVPRPPGPRQNHDVLPPYAPMIPTQVCNGVDHTRRFPDLVVAVAARSRDERLCSMAK